MRIGQPKEERRSWPRHFLSLVREIAPDYQLNHRARGTRTECLRELTPGGIYVSHNTFCLRGTYFQCFGLALSPVLSDPYMDSPYFIGGRFNHNLDIAMSFMTHMGLTVDDRRERRMSWHSTHEWRAGADDIVRRCTRTAEQHLLPFYLARVAAASESIGALLHVVARSARISEEELRERSGSVAPLDLGLFELTDPQHAWQGLPVPDRYYALVLAKSSLFRATQDLVPDMLKRLESAGRV